MLLAQEVVFEVGKVGFVSKLVVFDNERFYITGKAGKITQAFVKFSQKGLKNLELAIPQDYKSCGAEYFNSIKQ